MTPAHPNDDGNWDEWKDFRIYRASYNDWEGRGKKTSGRATSVTLTHEVWDHNSNCPVHRRSPVTVGIGGSTPPPDNNGGNAGNNGNGENGGSSDNGGNDGNGEDGGSSGNGGNRVAPTASISDATGVEGEVLRFEVTLSRSSDTAVTVDYQTAGGTALEGTDYDAASGTLTFGPGATRRTIEVRTHEDTDDEPNETFTGDVEQSERRHAAGCGRGGHHHRRSCAGPCGASAHRLRRQGARGGDTAVPSDPDSAR